MQFNNKDDTVFLRLNDSKCSYHTYYCHRFCYIIYQCRLPLPEPWRGVRDDSLSKLCGVPGCVFVHASGFIGGNMTYGGALLMAVKALEMKSTPPC